MRITLRAGEKLYLNGAVFKVDRKVSIELMNDATFLLEAHVMSVEKATTPLRQLYFVVQIMLMNPLDIEVALKMFNESYARMLVAYDDAAVLDAICKTSELVTKTRYFEALKLLRGVFDRDDQLMGRSRDDFALAG